MGTLRNVAAALLMGAALVAAAEPAGDVKMAAKPASARLFTTAARVIPGIPFEAGVHIVLADGWHTYADPPGDSGMAPIIALDLPEGWSRGPVRFPPHQTFTDAAGTTNGYEDEVKLTFDIAPPATNRDAQRIRITGRIQYLICRDICRPMEDKLELELNLAADPGGGKENTHPDQAME